MEYSTSTKWVPFYLDKNDLASKPSVLIVTIMHAYTVLFATNRLFSRYPPFLVLTGAECPVTSDNVVEYRARLARLRHLEYAPQAAAFRAGLEDALPGDILSLFTWREMEELLSGEDRDAW